MKGTKGDQYTKAMIERILKEGTWDKNPRPHYEDTYNGIYYPLDRTIVTNDNEIIELQDNQTIARDDNGIITVHTPAHTLSINHAEMTYDLHNGESPLITLRPIATQTSWAEILWIYQQESNDLVKFDQLLGKNTWATDGEIFNWWKKWALKNPDGSYQLNRKGHPHIGACYGGTVHKHKLMKDFMHELEVDPDGRRHQIDLWQVDDFRKPHALKPCAFLTEWNVRHEDDGKDYLDLKLVQRSSDFMTAGCINQIQYVEFLYAVARHFGYKVGRFTWSVDNVQIYDRHINQAKELLEREPIDCDPAIWVNEAKDNFYDLKTKDVKVVNYPREKILKKNPQVDLPLAV